MNPAVALATFPLRRAVFYTRPRANTTTPASLQVFSSDFDQEGTVGIGAGLKDVEGESPADPTGPAGSSSDRVGGAVIAALKHAVLSSPGVAPQGPPRERGRTC